MEARRAVQSSGVTGKVAEGGGLLGGMVMDSRRPAAKSHPGGIGSLGGLWHLKERNGR